MVLLKDMLKLLRLPLITAAVIAAIILITISTREYLGMNGRESIPVLSQRVILYFDQEGYNAPEQEVLASLVYEYQHNIPNSGKDSEEYKAYFKYLREYLAKDGVDLTAEEAKAATAKIRNFGSAIYHEKGVDIKDMSIDGKAATIYLAQKIYEICGLEISFNLDGSINLVKDTAGVALYQTPSAGNKVRIQMNVLMITLACIAAAFGGCLMISRKNHLFKEKNTYEPAEEKLYA